MSAPAITPNMPHVFERIQLLERFTARFFTMRQAIFLTTELGAIRVLLDQQGCPRFIANPAYTGKALQYPYIRVRSGTVRGPGLPKETQSDAVGYDLSTNEIIVFDEHERVLWRSGNITSITRVVIEV